MGTEMDQVRAALAADAFAVQWLDLDGVAVLDAARRLGVVAVPSVAGRVLAERVRLELSPLLGRVRADRDGLGVDVAAVQDHVWLAGLEPGMDPAVLGPAVEALSDVLGEYALAWQAELAAREAGREAAPRVLAASMLTGAVSAGSVFYAFPNPMYGLAAGTAVGTAAVLAGLAAGRHGVERVRGVLRSVLGRGDERSPVVAAQDLGPDGPGGFRVDGGSVRAVRLTGRARAAVELDPLRAADELRGRDWE